MGVRVPPPWTMALCLQFPPYLQCSLDPSILLSAVALGLEWSLSAPGVKGRWRRPRGPSGCTFLTWLPGLSDQGPKSLSSSLTPSPFPLCINFLELPVIKQHKLILSRSWASGQNPRCWQGRVGLWGDSFLTSVP